MNVVLGFLTNKYVLKLAAVFVVAFGLWYAYDTWHNKPVRLLKQEIVDNKATHAKEVEVLNDGIKATAEELVRFHDKYRSCEKSKPKNAVENTIKIVEEVEYEKENTNSVFDITDYSY